MCFLQQQKKRRKIHTDFILHIGFALSQKDQSGLSTKHIKGKFIQKDYFQKVTVFQSWISLVTGYSDCDCTVLRNRSSFKSGLCGEKEESGRLTGTYN